MYRPCLFAVCITLLTVPAHAMKCVRALKPLLGAVRPALRTIKPIHVKTGVAGVIITSVIAVEAKRFREEDAKCVQAFNKVDYTTFFELVSTRGVNVNIECNNDGDTALMLVASLPASTMEEDLLKQQLIARLLKLGANPLVKNKAGKTAYDCALTSGDTGNANILKEAAQRERAMRSDSWGMTTHEGNRIILPHK